MAEGGTALDAIGEVMDVRYGRARHALSLSPHTVELNNEAFRRRRELMIESALSFQARPPPLPAVDLRERYRVMFAAILYWTTEP